MLSAMAPMTAVARFTTPTLEDQWSDSRSRYKEALQYLDQGKADQFRSSRSSLEAELYPLAPYLTYYEYRKNINRVSDRKIISFIDDYQDSPIGSQLKQRWLRQLVSKGRWGDFITHFSPEHDLANAELLCNQARALYKEGKQQLAFAAAKKLWLVGRSQHKNCDPIFNAWQKSGGLNDKMVWQRIEISMDRGNVSLSRFLAKKLKSSALKEDFKLWERLFAAPYRLASEHERLGDNPRDRHIMLHTLSRWVRSDKPKTLQWLNTLSDEYAFTQAEKDQYINYIARYISFTFNPESKYWLLQVDIDNQDPKVLDKRFEVALRSADWPAVLLWSSMPPESKWEAAKFKYWRARALESLAAKQGERLLTFRYPEVNKDDVMFIHRLNKAAISTQHGGEYLSLGQFYEPMAATREARRLYAELAATRDFYGFLASEKLGLALSINDKVQPISKQTLSQVENTPGILRAKELYLMNERGQAYREWRHTLKDLQPTETGVAARLASQWGWEFQAILTAARSSDRDNITLRFPSKFQTVVSQEATRNAIYTDWVFAVIRQESAFREDAQSGVGAMGLMQLMPATARHVSRNTGAAKPSRSQLLSANYNINLGAAYLRELYDTFDQNIVMATAAYNAGPHRVKEWRPQDESMAGDVWIETIPFNETREYVKNIMTYQAIYKYKMGFKAQLSQDTQRIYPKSQRPAITLPTQIVSNPGQQTNL